MAAQGAVGEDGGIDGDMPLQHAGEAVAHLVGHGADRHDAGDVGGAIGILATRIDQIELARQDRGIALH
ncbi:hypothetical protein LTR94_038779, partial [Friedmanniomyces endolithicus]